MNDITERNFIGTIHAIPYSHADIAWVHSREWHIDRYILAVDEILDRIAGDDSYRFYFDTWIEMIDPYVKYRPERIPDMKKFIREGKIAICCGHYGNVRNSGTAVGDETFIRNLQIGMRKWRELVPEVNLSVYANLDVFIGHTQMPQLLSLAGLTGYFIQRPLELMDEAGVPRSFYWEGLSGDRILVCRQIYGGLYSPVERKGKTYDQNWDAAAQAAWNSYLKMMAKDGVADIPLCLGSDDTRPDRLLHGNDEPADHSDFIRLWNEREMSLMRYSTPDDLFKALANESEKLQVVSGVFDISDNPGNMAIHGHRGVWWLRECADRRLVEAEIFASVIALDAKIKYPESDFADLWERLLSWTPHAVQWLFRWDWKECETSLRRLIGDVESRIKTSVSEITQACRSLDAQGIALMSTVSDLRRKEIIPLWIVNSDLSRELARIIDKDGKEIAFQPTDYPVPSSEIGLLAEIDVPGCGYSTFKLEWEHLPPPDVVDLGEGRHDVTPVAKSRHKISERIDVTKGAFELDGDSIKLTFSDGLLVCIHSNCTKITREAPAGTSFLEPLKLALDNKDWWVYGISDTPHRLRVDKMTLDESGPLRWRVTREGTIDGCWLRQHIDIYKGENAVRSSVQFLPPATNEPCLITIGVPSKTGAKLYSDISFGIEDRDVDNTIYGKFERVVHGLFWCRTWACMQDSLGKMALLAADGEKYYRLFGDPRWLVHIIARKTPMFDTGWEKYIDTWDVSGREEFNHTLLLDAEDIDLVRTAEFARHPVSVTHVPDSMLGKERTFFSVEPESVRVSSMHFEGDSLVLRASNMSAEEVQAVFQLPMKPANAVLVDFNGNKMQSDIQVGDHLVKTTINPWQIVTFKIGVS